MAVCDVDDTRRVAAASISGAPIAVADYQRILERDDIDIVDICLPHYLHYRSVMESADARKHILCEKPIATKLADALQMIDRTEAQGVSFGVVYQNRYNTASVKVRQAGIHVDEQLVPPLEPKDGNLWHPRECRDRRQ
jgi:predicted dehydrogenase